MTDQAQALRERAAREKAEALQKRAAAMQSRLLANNEIRRQEVRQDENSTRYNQGQNAVAQGVV